MWRLKMKIAIYGVSRSGKDYFIKMLVNYFQQKNTSLHHLEGSKFLNRLANEFFKKNFSFLNTEEKDFIRKEFVSKLDSEEKKYGNIIVDGHYAFYNECYKLYKVFTEADRDAYDIFLYIHTSPIDIINRMKTSLGEKKNEVITEDQISIWQNYEISEMQCDLLMQNKELHIIHSEDDAMEYCYDVIVKGKYNSFDIAKAMVDKLELKDGPETIILTDCDKTLTLEDTTNIACDLKCIDKSIFKKIYANDIYTNYQAWQANLYIKENLNFNKEVFENITQKIHFKNELISDLKAKTAYKIFAITAGSSDIWQRLLIQIGLNAKVLSSDESIVSMYVKYFVVKLLKKKGKFVISLGDSILDSMMLKESNVGYIITQKGYRKNIENFLLKNPTIRQLKYFDYQYDFIFSDTNILPAKKLVINDNILSKINVCKSASGYTGTILRNAHYFLGTEVAKLIQTDYPNKDFAVIIMMRSGLLFGMAIADYFDCPVLFYNRDTTILLNEIYENKLESKILIICDGVVNTGTSIYSLINQIGLNNAIIATNVLSYKVNANINIPIYTSRISQKSFKGAKQKIIENNKGPDTSDRLFKLI